MGRLSVRQHQSLDSGATSNSGETDYFYVPIEALSQAGLAMLYRPSILTFGLNVKTLGSFGQGGLLSLQLGLERASIASSAGAPASAPTYV